MQTSSLVKPLGNCRRYCHLPASDRRMQRFLLFKLGSHRLPVVFGRLLETGM